MLQSTGRLFKWSCIALALVLTACAGEKADEWSATNLMKYDIPVSIMAPDSATVQAGSVSGIVRDVTVLSEEDNYAVQIFSGQAFTQDLTRLKSNQLDLVRSNRYFERIVEEETAGFIFENKIDSTSNFGFRYILFKGDKEIIFQNGMGRIFTEAQARKMYQAVTQ